MMLPIPLLSQAAFCCLPQSALHGETDVGPELTAWCGSDAVSAAAPPARRPESDRWKESGEVTSRQNACGFPPVARVVLRDAQVVIDPVADRAVQLEPELRVQRSWPTTRRDDVERRRLCQRMEWPNCDTGL